MFIMLLKKYRRTKENFERMKNINSSQYVNIIIKYNYLSSTNYYFDIVYHFLTTQLQSNFSEFQFDKHYDIIVALNSLYYLLNDDKFSSYEGIRFGHLYNRNTSLSFSYNWFNTSPLSSATWMIYFFLGFFIKMKKINYISQHLILNIFFEDNIITQWQQSTSNIN